jgi:5'-3' exonuclease
MGIPKMFRFLTDRYPLILQSLDEDNVFDNFYLDMNGIIHQCTHPNDNSFAILDVETMYDSIFAYTERLFRIVGPRKLMYLAIDGVAPRAKMNQQRARRFRSAKDAERSMLEAIARGDEIPSGTPFDSNCITPGTQFMTELSVRFQSWIDEKMKSDPAWQQGCTVVFSGSEVPGEGEHKLVDYIRKWRQSDDYSPNIRHCMYGLDADLLMLGLVAHVPHFTLIREKMKFHKGGRKVPKMRGSNNDANEFHLLEIALLRDMLFLEFTRPSGDAKNAMVRPQVGPNEADRVAVALSEQRKNPDRTVPDDAGANNLKKPPFKCDAFRIADDFVFMCMLVGNDFLPNLPHLDIAEGALNLMFRVYKSKINVWRGYLTDQHRLHPDRLQDFLLEIADGERHYFAARSFDDGVPEYKTAAYRRAYYQLKFGFDADTPEGQARVHDLRRIHLEGLHWCLQYYHQGVPSWNWFYPDFYGPLSSDMVDLRSVRIVFRKGQPFSPITQLMAVLPPHSAQFLPKPMRDLMIDPLSPVVDFYPPEFQVDPNGKRNSWEAVVIIPFIDEKRLLSQISEIDRENELTKDERIRDLTGVEHWFRSQDYPRSRVRIPLVRPSKYSPGNNGSVRSRSQSPSSDRTRSQSPRSTRKPVDGFSSVQSPASRNGSGVRGDGLGGPGGETTRGRSGQDRHPWRPRNAETDSRPEQPPRTGTGSSPPRGNSRR